MKKPILYLGDTSLAGGAGYLAGVMSSRQLGYEYLPSAIPVNGEAEELRKLYIFSDYPSAHLCVQAQEQVIWNVCQGAGLLMIGGWESFQGGDWGSTDLAKLLPVKIESTDDRINCDQPAMVHCLRKAHPICAALPWDARPPMIGGFNRFTAKADAETILEVQRFNVRHDEQAFQFAAVERHPLLVVGHYGKGRTAALATDLAPHWVGGLLDWGTGQRVVAEAPGCSAIEVGASYAQFIFNLLSWTGQIHG